MAETNIPRLRELRDFHQVTQAQIAAHLGIAKRTVIRWEQGEQDPNLTDLRKMAEFFGVSVAYLVGEAERRGTPQV